MNIAEVLKRLEAAERDFLAREVLAPVLAGRGVRVRIAGVVCSLRVDDPSDHPSFEGWAVLRPLALDRARIVRPARLAEVAAYLRLFPAVRLIALARAGRSWHALPASGGDRRVRIERPVPVAFVEDGVQPFETLVARFDGARFWYARRDGRRNPALAAYLRQALNEETPPERVRKQGLSAEERAAYAWAWGLLEAARQAGIAGQLADALMHAGGRLVDFTERDESYTVAYLVGDARHISTIRKDDLSVLTAGICLAGRDHDFDLTSLVSVMRESAGRRVPRVGGAAAGLSEEAYHALYDEAGPADEG